MALSAHLPSPGDDRLCEGDCNHADCEAMRRTASTFCIYCGQAIGFGSQYVVLPDKRGGEHPVHEDCFEEDYLEGRDERDRQRFIGQGLMR